MTRTQKLLSTLAILGCFGLAAAAIGDAQPAGAVKPGPDILYWAPAKSPQLENTGIWKAQPILISGATAYRNGEFLYQDYLLDDRGAGQRALYPPALKASTADNSSDILEVRIKPTANATAFRISYNTMVDAEVVAATIALGDGVAQAALPFGANGKMPATVFVTVHGAIATATDAATGAVLPGKVTATVDRVRRQVEIRVPYSVFDTRGKTVRIAAGAGVWDRQAGRYATPADPPGPPPPEPGAAPNPNRRPIPPLPAERSLLFNMAFRTTETLNVNSQLPFYNDAQQSDALWKGDLSPFYTNVDFNKLAAGANDDSALPTKGFMSRILVSHFEPAQGRGEDAKRLGLLCDKPCIPQFGNRLMPYGLYVPNKAPPASGYGLTIDIHSAGASYARWLGGSRQVEAGERGTGSIVITPSARGTSSGYVSEAEAEVFEVWADVARLYKIDTDYVTLAGVSMGAIGSFKLAGQFPDLFAAVAVSVGCPTEQTAVNLREVPAMMHTGDIDTQTECRPGNRSLEKYLKTNDQYRWWNFMNHPHPFSSRPRNWQPFADFLGDKRRAPDPARVTYAVDLGQIEPTYGINPDHAYWVSGVKVRDPNKKFVVDEKDPVAARTGAGGYGVVDVFSHGFGKGDPVRVTPIRDTGTFNFGVADYPWPNYISYESKRGPVPAIPVSDVLDIRAENVAAVTIDPVRAKVTCNAKINVTSDGPLNVTLLGCRK